jgi:methionyl-tRNA formyltransferase
MKIMLILGGDRIALRALGEICVSENLTVVLDKSTSIKRVLRLLIKRRLKLFVLLKMVLCEFFRVKPQVSISHFPSIKNNQDLLDLIDKCSPEKIFLFRAGLVINEKVIARGIPLMNIHCAKVPEYGGLGSIDRAITDRAVEQNATLHQVTVAIDRGATVDIEPFTLDLTKGYCFNENIAYQAGLRLLKRTINFS